MQVIASLIRLRLVLSADAPGSIRVAPRHLVRVVLWMTGALLSFSAMAVSIRVLAGTLSIMEILRRRAPASA